MRKVKVSLPAALTNLGPGLGSLGLALSLRANVEIRERTDEQWVVETSGEGGCDVGLRHPVALALMRVFQTLERAPLGITVKVENRIPAACGLGAETALAVAGVVAANNLIGNPFSREQVLHLASEVTGRPDAAVTTLLGGLIASAMLGDEPGVTYRQLPVAAFQVVVCVPDIEGYAEEMRQIAPETVLYDSALNNLKRMPLLLEALRAGDYQLLAKVMDDGLRAPLLRASIAGYANVVEYARRAGAAAITLSGDGPALVAFAEKDHKRIAEAMVTAFTEAGAKARTWTLPVDTQGVVLSAAQSA